MKTEDGCGQRCGNGERDEKSCAERLPPAAGAGGHQLGDGGLDGAGAQCEGDPVNRKDHLIQPQSLRPDGARQENTVEKAENTA